jgi:GntR family transcriptional regulator / MocR family aminotransferase
VAAAKFVADWHTALPLQAALAGFLDQGWFARHVRRMRGVYAERHRRIVEILGDRPVRWRPRAGRPGRGSP